MINNKFLYAFENSKEKFKVVKCKIAEIGPFGDIKIKKERQIEQKFFGVVSKINNNKIQFLGGQFLNISNNLSPKNYEFNFNTNELILTDIRFDNIDFFEKTFIPLEKNNYMKRTEFRINHGYIPKIIICGDKKQGAQLIDDEEKIKSKSKFFEEGFDSLESNKIKFFIPNKSTQSINN